jgi:hypothetical protein
MKELNIQEKDLELVVSEKTLGSLTTNVKQIKALVEASLPNYDISNYNESNIDLAKKDKAMLNKASKALNAKRLEFEKEFMKPFSEFKEIVSDTVKLIAECSLKIDVVVKQSEQKYKDDKKSTIQKLYDGKGFTLVPFSKIFDEKWLNKTTKEKDINLDIDSRIAKIKDDIITLEAIGEDVDLLKSLYLDTLNINSTIQYANTLKANREKVKAESEKAVSPVVQTQTAPELKKATKISDLQVEVYVRAFKVSGTREDIIALSEFMNNRGIKFEKIEL